MKLEEIVIWESFQGVAVHRNKFESAKELSGTIRMTSVPFVAQRLWRCESVPFLIF